ncbi:MAG: class I SAM-dependent methyltransferase [Anaerolineae bacterium]|nr:class I SAM-dependent methyltransferase [Candidatus Roseilinea sp.]MDW8448445.1 class I SAM-dependent methyltransferase [Anaerolineae bacterium]
MTETTLGYEYWGLLASTWDLWRDDTANWADRQLFLEVIRRYGEPVLDIGCATGRLILDFLGQGIDCDGVDISPEMLAITHAKAAARGLRPNLYQQHMEALDLLRAYRTILVPSSSFQLITDASAAQEAMRRFYSHLLPGGVLVMPFFLPWQPGQPLEADWSLVFEKARAEDGLKVRRWSYERYEPNVQLWHSKDRFEVVRGDEVIDTENHERSPAGRWYSQAQAVALYEANGFVNVRVTSEFTDAPAAEGDMLFCVWGEKRS